MGGPQLVYGSPQKYCEPSREAQLHSPNFDEIDHTGGFDPDFGSSTRRRSSGNRREAQLLQTDVEKRRSPELDEIDHTGEFAPDFGGADPVAPEMDEVDQSGAG